MRRTERRARRRRPSGVPFGFSSQRRPPWRRWFAIIIIVVLALTAPLLAHAQALPDSVVLGWTESGDDGTTGTPTLVELRMSGAAITLANWDLATLVPGLPAPALGGTPQTVVVRGLTPGATYYFALRSSDEAGNWSGLSNLVLWDGSVDVTSPAPPGGLAAARTGNTARLTWTPNTEPDLAGYNIYRATNASGPFTRMNDSLLVNTQFDDTSLPAGIDAAWYRLTALDLSGNLSAAGPAISVLLTAAAVVLKPAYPNPSPLTSDVRIPVLVSDSPAGARLDVLDSGGRRVRRFDLSTLAPGAGEVVWNGRNDAGRLVAPGVYSAFLVGDGLAQVVRMVRVP